MTTVPMTSQPTAPGPAATAPAGSMAGLTADPAPLGLAAFGITTMVLSAINAAWIGAAAIPVVLALALPFGGIGQAQDRLDLIAQENDRYNQQHR